MTVKSIQPRPYQYPEWMQSLRGFDQVMVQRCQNAANGSGTWEITLQLPDSVAEIASDVDPLLLLPVLAETQNGINAKVAEIVRFCRSNGRSWTHIGQALGVSKQAAWERFSGED